MRLQENQQSHSTIRVFLGSNNQMIKIVSSFLIFILVSPVAFAAGANETLFTILSNTGFTAVKAASTETIAVENVFCEEKSATKVKCTASQGGSMMKIADSPAFLRALRGEPSASAAAPAAAAENFLAKKIYTFKSLECSRHLSADGSAFYSCSVVPLE